MLLSCVCLVDSPLNCILWYPSEPCSCSSRVNENRHVQQNDSVEHFLLQISPKMMNGLQVCWVLIHLFLSLSFHSASWQCQKKKRFRVASCKCLMLLHRGAAKSCPAEWGTVYWRYSLISVVFLLLIRPSALVSFVYLFYKNELMPFQIVCTF